MVSKCILVAAGLGVAGCQGLYGPQPIVGPEGVVRRAAADDPGSAVRPERSPGAVAGLAGASGPPRLYDDYWARAGRAARDGASQAEIDSFMLTGFALIEAECDSFFRRAGRNQSASSLGRDLIGPFVALITGSLALAGVADADRRQRLLQALSLGSGFVTSGLDVYDKHFLFGAENIDAVRELSFNALAAHRDKVLEYESITYLDALGHLTRHFNTCTPPRILALTRRAIAAGRVDARAARAPADREAGDVRRALGDLLDPPSSLSDDQLFALWWLFEGQPAESEYETIHKALDGLPADVNPVARTTAADGTARYAFAATARHRREVEEAMAELPAEATARFEKRLATLRGGKGAESAPAGLKEGLRAPPAPPPPRRPRGSQRIVVDIAG